MSNEASFRLTNDNIAVKKNEVKEEVTPGGIVLTGSAAKKPTTGKVIAIGSGRLLESGGGRALLEVKVGDTVVFGDYAGIDVVIDGEKMTVIRESDVIIIR